MSAGHFSIKKNIIKEIKQNKEKILILHLLITVGQFQKKKIFSLQSGTLTHKYIPLDSLIEKYKKFNIADIYFPLVFENTSFIMTSFSNFLVCQ